jgi:hypothetical protein
LGLLSFFFPMRWVGNTEPQKRFFSLQVVRNRTFEGRLRNARDFQGGDTIGTRARSVTRRVELQAQQEQRFLLLFIEKAREVEQVWDARCENFLIYTPNARRDHV